MRGPEHVSVAVLTTGGALWLMNGQMDLSGPAVAAIGAAAIGALVPDIDHPKAWISNRIPGSLIALGLMTLLGFWFVGWTVRRDPSQMFGPVFTGMLDAVRPHLGWAWLALAIGIALLVASMVIAAMVEHRGPTHSLSVGFGLTLVALVGFAIIGRPALGLWFGWGYLTHLLTDAMTPMGCPAFLWPWRPGDSPFWRTPKPAIRPMTVPGAQETATPSTNTSVGANGDSGLAQPVEDLSIHMTTGFAEDVLAPSDLNSGRQDKG